MTEEATTHSRAFNSALETGLRSLCVLSAAEPNKYDIQQLLAFDHIIVHSGDVGGGPQSLHPDVSQRNGELLVRRPLVTNGLLLMASKGLLLREGTEDGIKYCASDLTTTFLKSLSNKYVEKLVERAQWAVHQFDSLGEDIFHEVFNTAFDRWTSEFQFSTIKLGGY